jgi:sugar phosphate isomerase/epimerase
MNNRIVNDVPHGAAPLSRRAFLTRAAVATSALASPPLAQAGGAAHETQFPELGVCRSPGEVTQVARGGYAYIEAGVRSLLLPDKPQEAFEAGLRQIRDAGIPVPACNGFFPGDTKLVGPEPQTAAALPYAETTFERAARAGVRIIVLGSGGARRIPEGFDPDRARGQFISFCRQLGPRAEAHDVTVALEPLNRGETDLINTVSEAVTVVDEVDHPSIRLVADLYHMLRENESATAIRKAGKRICHCHVADREQRTPPGTAGDDFRPFFAALKSVGYHGRISVECHWPKPDDLLPVLQTARRTILDQWATA